VSHYSASFSVTVRVRLEDRPGTFAQLARAIADAGGLLDAIDLVRVEDGSKIRDVTFQATDAEHADRIVEAVSSLHGISVEQTSDRTFLMHLGGKIHMESNIPVKTRDDLSMAYTPGVARVCQRIAEDRDAAWNLTIKKNTVAVVSDGSAVLGLGNIGPEAAMPVMEGKALLFKEFAGVDAWPICLDTQDVDGIVAAVEAIAPGFGGINLEDISGPRCFEIEERLRAALDIPVFHDDQHGTAVVVLAALQSALRLTERSPEGTRVVIQGAGAAGVAVARILLEAGVRDLAVLDRQGVVHSSRLDLTPVKRQLAVQTADVFDRRGSLADVMAGADVYIGVSGGTVPEEIVASMADEAIIFGLANPNPEVHPDVAHRHARVVATGRSDFPNQINNVLAFPGIFRGAFDVGATAITEGMKLAAANALAELVGDDLSEDLIVPSPFDQRVGPAVSAAVSEAARADGVATR
jgi:malate dehydrogenase (oxaloacetate-decarboxylating)